MTHPNFQTNGASLEDCHTNFFALTELSGIKWRKLVYWDLGGGGALGGHCGGGNNDPLDDPVLRSYARCLAADILCVWRRVSTPRPPADMFDQGGGAQPPPPLSLATSKELWIFWYGEEPDLSVLIAPEINTPDCEQGSWESGLSYECRSLLFKALHNLIERCLLSRDFIRLGKWFVQPYDGPKKTETNTISSSTHLSFSFAFFVHGESSVCASVDVRQHPPVRRLTRFHLQQAQTATNGLKVILAPFGLAGILTGQSYKSPDLNQRLLDEWSQFYPLDKSSSLIDSNLVEVIVGGVKMKYPSCYVLVTDLDDTTNSSVLTGGGGGGGTTLPSSPTSATSQLVKNGTSSPILVQTPPPSPVQINSRVPQPGPHTVSCEHPLAMSRDETAATILPERVWQECVHNGPASNSAEFSGQWDFVDPIKRANCTCSKCRKYVGGSGMSKWSSGSSSSMKQSSSKSGKSMRGRIPFHRRCPVSPNDRCSSGSYTPQGGPPSYPRTQESIAVPSVGSPPSAPSPLPNSHSQPASVPPGDQTMPMLSPHPPTTLPSPSVLDTKPESTPDHHLHPPKSNSPSGGLDTKLDQSNNNNNNNVATVPVLKRPILSVKEYENCVGDEEQTLDMLYDYTTLTAWLNHPVKRFKPDANESKRGNQLGKVDIYSLYNQNGTTTINNNEMLGNTIKSQIKQEPIEFGDINLLQTPMHGMKRPGDPYEFDEEGAANNLIDGFKRGQPVPIKEEPNDSKKTLTGNYFTSEGLQPSYKDLDQIFDNSDDTSSDETMQTPPGTAMSIHDDNRRLSSHGTCSNIGILRPEELSKMFPTPPSLEHNPIASPSGQHELLLTDYTDMGLVRIKQDIYPNMGSPQEEAIDDWSFVFRPPASCKLVGSSKYAPLTNLPSQCQPTVSVPTHCVYKPSWVQHAEKPPMTAPPPPQPPPATPASQFPPSPLPTGFRQPPPPYELPSPATSTASSYMNKNLNSVEPQQTQLVQRTPEASSLALNILLTDTASNIFRDHNFDSCTLCVCNAEQRVAGNIRGADAGLYLNNTCDRVQMVQQAAAAAHHQHQQQDNSPFGMGQPPPYGGMMASPPPQQTMQLDEDCIRCSCGFSAVVNRKLAYGSGLFYEDEMEITGIAEDPGEKKKSSILSYLMSTNSIKNDPNIDRDQVDIQPHSLLELIREQCVFIPSTANSIFRAARYIRTTKTTTTISQTNQIHLLEYKDTNEITIIALEQSKLLDISIKMEELHHHHHHHHHPHHHQPLHHPTKKQTGATVHRWPFLRANGPQCNQDIVRVMQALQPLLQEAIQKKCQTRLWEAPSAVKGPLTWRQFHRLAGRGTDDRCEPQPIPSVVVGHDKDWLSLSPYAIQHWESLLLEPYSFARDVAYIVVAPENDAVLPRVRTFFKELSTAYEMCKLGRHSPITKVLRDGILRVGKTAKAKIGNEPVEEWFTLLGESELTEMLKLYAQVCKHHLAPHLQQVPMDKTLLDPPSDGGDGSRPTPSPMPPPDEKAPNTPKSEETEPKDNSPSSATTAVAENALEEDERDVPSVVVYLVEPFTLGCDQPELQRLACLALLRCFQSVLASVPENIRNNITVQIISLESIVELGKARDRTRHSDHMRALSLNIFSQCRRLLIHSNTVKSLTGFGTAAMADLFLKTKDEKNRAAYKLYTPPYILAPMREKVEAIESFGKGNSDQASVLYLSYCLSEDQSWLLAVATDERGEIFETVIINIDIPNRARRKKASARRIGLEKLMNFILGVMSQSVRPWRLVVGRLGRIGHGELKGWSWLLSKKNLMKASKTLKEICNQCSLLYPSSVPCILSACLVSLEPDSVLRLMSDQFTPDERFSQVSVNSQLSTPQDVSCTHILVFPTSATTQSSQTAFQEQHITPELGDDELFNALNDDMGDGIDEINEFGDIFNWSETGPGGGQSPTGSPRREESGPGSPGYGINNRGQGSPFQFGANNSKGGELAEEVGQLLQQPLALGYFVSTAPTGRMPKWFWSSCPHLEGVCPVFLKNALHLHSPNIQQNSDDLFQQSASVTSHPLDSQFTTDVLRYVLEGYNALSWLALDSNTRDRLSCLPVHMQVLVQLYHTTGALL